jgi:hypothetical protein
MKSIEFLLEKYKSQNTLLFSDDFKQAKEIYKQEQEEVYNHAFNYGVNFSKQEISDEEIEKGAEWLYYNEKLAWIEGAKWYKEQLKQKL